MTELLYDPGFSSGTLVELFRETVTHHQDLAAVSDRRQTLTYRDLDERSDAVADLLQGRGLGSEDRVVLYLPRSADLVVGLLGILKSGAAYVAVDTGYPDSRRDLMLRESGAKAVLTDSAGADRLPAGLDAEILEWTAPGMAAPPASSPAEPGSAASVLFTSGSSGTPKAIVLEHRNLVSFARNPALPAPLAGERVGQISNVSFDAFHFEVWCSLAQGAEIVVLPPAADLLATGLGAELRRQRISVLLVPTAFANTMMREDPTSFSSLRILHTGGDVLSPASCRALLESGFSGSLFNLYGPSEATTACVFHRVDHVDPGDTTVPIGRPLAGAAAHVLDDEQRPVRPGEVGELHVSGLGVARGYANNAELTKEKFRPDQATSGGYRMYATGDLVRQRPDGNLEFVGRVDDQVKVRGYRVEPGEVERLLQRHPRVTDVAVLSAGEGDARHLIAFVVHEDALCSEDLRFLAAEELPDYMVPSRFVRIPAIPVNDHGKRDRAALIELASHAERGQPAPAPTRPGTQRFLADLWCELLGVTMVSASDDFFTLGGNSLSAFNIVRRVQQDLGASVGFRCILDNPVLEDLAAAIDTALADDPGHPAENPGTAG